MKRFAAYLMLVALLAASLAACAPAAPSAEPTADRGQSTADSRPPTAAATAAETQPVSTEPPSAGLYTLRPGETPVVISEVLAGIQGNNIYEFIELYNRSGQPVDLHGWAIWYRLPTSAEDLFVYRWQTSALIPPYGHYLLGHVGEELGLPVDAEFEQSLNTGGGGLQLRQTDGTPLDALAWGKAPAAFTEGTPAPALENGQSLERLPQAELGNFDDSGDNAVDFSVNSQPNPQNTGSSLTPLPAERMEISVSAPETVQPGSSFEYTITVVNHTAKTLENVVVTFPVYSELTVGTLPEGMTSAENVVAWALPALAAGETQSAVVPVSAPWSQFVALAANYSAQAENFPLAAFGGPLRTRVEGGVIPIATARTLVNAELTIEGIATAYTGAYFAGNGNVKFYMSDETGGIQVQVFGGQGEVNVKIGDRVRVHGEVGAYRGSMQIVPVVVPDDVTVLEASTGLAAAPQVSAPIAAAALVTDPRQGQLVQVEGKVTRVEEFTYSYEIDLADEEFNLLTLYVDKQTNMLVEMVEVGQLYRATGILDVRDTLMLLYPRVQADLQEVFPAVLLLDADGPTTVAAGGQITYTLTAWNHTANPLTGVAVHVASPVGTSIVEVLDGGRREGAQVWWDIAEIAPNGGSAAVRVVVAVAPDAPEQLALREAAASANEWIEPVIAATVRTFTGGKVPVWAIQSDGFRSPYVFERVATAGVVTGVFPGLGGFFMQESADDGDSRTSPGLFVVTGNLEFPVAMGDALVVTGTVREPSGMTALLPATLDDVTVLSQNNPLPLAVELDPPTATVQAEVYFEGLEGSLVQVSGPAPAVSPTSRYGEYVVVQAWRAVTRLFQGEDNGVAIMVDDGDSIAHQDRSTMAYAVATGDALSGLVGPLAYTYGVYKIEPIAVPVILPANRPATSIQPAGEGEFSVMTWNVENLFDTLDPHPADPPRPKPSEYQTQLAKVASTIVAAGAPSVVALQEVENIGVLESLAAHEMLAAYGYQPVLVEGFDSRYIDVGYLVRGDVTIVDVQQRTAPEGLTSRPPLIVKLEMPTKNGAATFYLINNHFTSMSGGEEATEPRRNAQAAWNVTLLQEIQAQDPQAMVAVLGDLNSYLGSKPIQTLRDSGLQHVFDTLPEDARYTYIFQGESQVLDHILITPALLEWLVRVEVLHINADYPLPLPDDASPTHKSDHDPVVVVFAAP